MKRNTWMSVMTAAALACSALPIRAAEPTGREVFDHYCTYCHGADDGAGTLQLGRTRGKDQALLLQRTNLTPDYIRYVVRHGLKSMPPFTPSDLSEPRLQALLAFLAK